MPGQNLSAGWVRADDHDRAERHCQRRTERLGWSSFAGTQRFAPAIAPLACMPLRPANDLLRRRKILRLRVTSRSRWSRTAPGTVFTRRSRMTLPSGGLHRDFLLLRDYAGLCALFVVFYGAAGIFAIPSIKIGLIYLLMLVIQYVLVRQAAYNYGVRMVTTVLARRAAKDGADVPKPPRKRTRSKADAAKGQGKG